MARTLVTVAPPTPNGDLHLGHLAGPFLAADVFTRARRQQGDDVVLLCYSDDYQSYLSRKARELKVDETSLAKANAEKIEETLAMADVALDGFLKARQGTAYRDAVALFYAKAVARGAVGTRVRPVPYCAACDVYGYEAFARGTCNHCGEPSDASQCEGCANAPDVTKMGPMACIFCKAPMEWREIEREHLKIGLYRGFLQSLYEGKAIRPWLRTFLDEVFATEDLEWPITRPHECGVEIDVGGKKIVHTWFGGMPGYYAALTEYAERRGDPELVQQYFGSKDTSIVHFLGFDCSFSHAVVYPTLLSNFGVFTTRVNVVTNAFLKLNGGDFSTSRGHAIWIRDILREVTPDCLRLYLALVAPEHAPSNFDVNEFWQWKGAVWDGVARIVDAAKAEVGSGLALAFDAGDIEALDALRGAWLQAGSAEGFSLRDMARVLTSLLATMAAKVESGRGRVGGLLAVYAVFAEALQPTLAKATREALRVDAAPILAWARGEEKAIALDLQRAAAA